MYLYKKKKKNREINRQRSYNNSNYRKRSKKCVVDIVNI